MNEDFFDIDFHHGLPSHSFVDKKSEVRVNIGKPSSVAPPYQHYIKEYGGVLLGIQSSGIARDRLDQMCNLLALNCRSLGVDILVVKSDRPFDSQWYFFGDIEGLLRAARDDLVRPPFTNAVHDQILRAMTIIMRK